MRSDGKIRIAAGDDRSRPNRKNQKNGSEDCATADDDERIILMRMRMIHRRCPWRFVQWVILLLISTTSAISAFRISSSIARRITAHHHHHHQQQQQQQQQRYPGGSVCVSSALSAMSSSSSSSSSPIEQKNSKKEQKYRSYQWDVVNRLKEVCGGGGGGNDELDSSSSSLFEMIQYGALSHNPTRYPLVAAKSRSWGRKDPSKNNNPYYMLVTAGVHGSERSGIEGCLEFLEQYRDQREQQQQQQQQQQQPPISSSASCNLLVVPCVSPWSYEWGTRCQANRKDPNRSFSSLSSSSSSSSFHPNPYQTEEAQALMKLLQNEQLLSMNVPPLRAHDGGLQSQSQSQSCWTCHLDLHETRPGGQDQGGAFDIILGQEEGQGENGGRQNQAEQDWMMSIDPYSIPQGVYLVVDDNNVDEDVGVAPSQNDFQRAVLNSIQAVLPILQGRQRTTAHHHDDDDGRPRRHYDSGHQESLFDRIQDGVLAVPTQALGLCSSTTQARYVATTEVCRSVAENSNDAIYRQAQVAAIVGALNFVESHLIVNDKKKNETPL